jgi:4'-phosphopantetheinyl transferase
VYVWCGGVAQQLREAASTVHWLSPSEEQRLRAITASRRRDQFLAGRWLVRQALISLHGGAPADWPLSAPPDAPPQVAGGPAIGLSHSGDRAACVLSEDPVGIDIECHDRRELDIAGLAAIALNEHEHSRFVALAPGEPQRMAFLALWTLKEAWLKARGEPLSVPSLARIEAMPCADAHANARVWQAARYTLAVVGIDATTPVVVAGSQAPQVAPRLWRVQLTSA